MIVWWLPYKEIVMTVTVFVIFSVLALYIGVCIVQFRRLSR